MFERFTETARQVVVQAQEVVRERDEMDRIDTVAVLLGLLRNEGSLAARVLAGLGITVEQVNDAWELPQREGLASGATPNGDVHGPVPFTRDAKEALELALREALSLGHNYIGTEHIMLGLLRRENTAGTMLVALGVDASRVRSETMRMLTAAPDTARVARAHERSILARQAYEVYVSALADLFREGHYTGPACPAWEFLNEAERKAWSAVALARAES